LKYDAQKDFVVDLDNVWKWLDFSYKHQAKLLLKKITKFCSTQRLIKILLPKVREQKKKQGEVTTKK